jgi:hypothetical protein
LSTKTKELVGYQNPINDTFEVLVSRGVIVPASIQAAPRFNTPQPEPISTPVIDRGEDEDEDGGPDELPSGYEDPEGGVAGDMSPEDVDAGFPKKLTPWGDEEPDIEDIETANVAAGGMSDEEYEDFMQYTDLRDKLAKVNSNLLQTKRYKGTVGDIKGSSSGAKEAAGLIALKDKIQAKMNDLYNSSKYLQANYKGKLTKKDEPVVLDEPEELDEWTKSRMQYYAGIK